MYSLMTVFGWCCLSMLLGIVLALGIVLYLLKTNEEYHEPDDFIDADWAKDYEEIKNGH